MNLANCESTLWWSENCWPPSFFVLSGCWSIHLFQNHTQSHWATAATQNLKKKKSGCENLDMKFPVTHVWLEVLKASTASYDETAPVWTFITHCVALLDVSWQMPARFKSYLEMSHIVSYSHPNSKGQRDSAPWELHKHLVMIVQTEWVKMRMTGSAAGGWKQSRSYILVCRLSEVSLCGGF